MIDLSKMKCIPCEGGVPPLEGDKLKEFTDSLPDWKCIDEKKLEKKFTFKDFKEAQVFTNKVGDLAEEIGHHPDILLQWGKVTVTIWTHKINGLADADFVFAAKVNEL